MRNLIATSALFAATVSIAQTPVLSFDGVNDYVDLGSTVGTGLRTIECWFKLDVAFDQNSTVRSSLLTRNTTTEAHEIQVSLQESSQPHPGSMGFGISVGPSPTDYYWAYSDTNAWPANEWFHVAAVIHPFDGLTLFINGIKQQLTEPVVTTATAASPNILAIGVHGDAAIRWFAGQIDDVRLSTLALYNQNFEPQCPDALPHASSVAVFNFNEGSGTTAADSSLNGNNGTIHGAQYETELICVSTGLSPDVNWQVLSVYPNPCNKWAMIDLDQGIEFPCHVVVRNIGGQAVLNMTATQSRFLFDLEHLDPGIYFVQLKTSSRAALAGKLVVN